MSQPKFPVKKACPTCKAQDSIVIEKNKIYCQKNDCDFSLTYDCPICNHHLSSLDYGENSQGDVINCPQCSNSIPLKKIANLIEFSMIVDHENRCELCGGPTIHHLEMNLGGRCFFYPACSGQGDLFGGEQKQTYCFIDFETTGLEVGKDYIIEIGAVKIDAEGYESVYQSFVKPPVPINPKITQLTGISDDDVADAPSLEHTFKELLLFVGDAKIVMHNADFDLMWFVATILRFNWRMPENSVICTLKWARDSAEPRCSLTALTKKYQLRHNNAHRALADAAATKELFFIFENAKRAKPKDIEISSFVKAAQKIVQRYEAMTQN